MRVICLDGRSIVRETRRATTLGVVGLVVGRVAGHLGDTAAVAGNRHQAVLARGIATGDDGKLVAFPYHLSGPERQDKKIHHQGGAADGTDGQEQIGPGGDGMVASFTFVNLDHDNGRQ